MATSVADSMMVDMSSSISGECNDYPNDHFHHVYCDIIKPAVEYANFTPIRADEVRETNLIHLDILKKLVEAPMAVCDLSTRNPNVLFELGIRQAFDKPVVLIQEKGTPRIFDINPLRYLEYSKDMRYHEVIHTQEELKKAIEATYKSINENGNINSIVRLMSLNSPATIPHLNKSNKETLTLDVISFQVAELRKMMDFLINNRKEFPVLHYHPQILFDCKHIESRLNNLVKTRNNDKDKELINKEYDMLLDKINEDIAKYQSLSKCDLLYQLKDKINLFKDRFNNN